MGILAQCPVCRRKQGTKNKTCISCGRDLEKAKKQQKVKFYISYRLDGKQHRELVGTKISDVVRFDQASEWLVDDGLGTF